MMLAALVSPAHADVSLACRVPAALLPLDAELKRVEYLVDRSQPVRILRIRPPSDLRSLNNANRVTLDRELARRLPDVIFTIIEARPLPGGARNDFEQIRATIDIVDPDLVIWQLGTGDALAATDPDDFAETLEEAADWIEARDVDLLVVDPPFVRDVPYERRYIQLVEQLDAISLRDKVNVVSQYDVTRYLLNRPLTTSIEAGKGLDTGKALGTGKSLDLSKALGVRVDTSSGCMPELMAEAIVRAATR